MKTGPARIGRGRSDINLDNSIHYTIMSKTEALTTFLFAGVSRYQTAQKNFFDTGELQQLNHNLKIGTAIFLFHVC